MAAESMLVLVQLCPPSRWLAVSSTGVEISSSSEQHQYYWLLTLKFLVAYIQNHMDKLLLHYNNNYAYEYLRGPPGVCIQWYVGINALWCGPSTSHWRKSLRILLFFFKSAKSLPSSCDASILGWGPIKKIRINRQVFDIWLRFYKRNFGST